MCFESFVSYRHDEGPVHQCHQNVMGQRLIEEEGLTGNGNLVEGSNLHHLSFGFRKFRIDGFLDEAVDVSEGFHTCLPSGR